jgi:hypothetical protein
MSKKDRHRVGIEYGCSTIKFKRSRCFLISMGLITLLVGGCSIGATRRR